MLRTRRPCARILYFIRYLLVLCGLCLGLRIGGYCPQLLAAELIFDDVDIEDSDDTEDDLSDSDADTVSDTEVSEESDDDIEVDSESDDISDDDSDSDIEVDSDDITDDLEDSAKEGLSDSTDFTVDYSIDYDALTDAIVDAIVTADAELSLLEEDSYDGTISTTYLSYFAGIYLKYATPTDDYLLYRSDQYTYKLIIGDLSLASTTFSGSGCTIISVYTRTSTGYTPTYTVSSDDILVTADNYYCYSNLGDFAPLPDLAKLVYQQQIIFVGVFIGLMIFIHGLIIFRKGD